MCRPSTSISHVIRNFDRPLGTACGSVCAGYMRAAQEMSTAAAGSRTGLVLGMCDEISVVQDARQRRPRAPTTTSSPGPGDRVQRIHAVPWRGPGPCGVLNDSARRLRPCWLHARPRSRKRNVFAASRVGFSTRFLTRHERKLCINLKRKARYSAHENAFEYTSLMVEPVGSPWGSTLPKRPRPRVHRAHPARPNARALACTCSSPNRPASAPPRQPPAHPPSGPSPTCPRPQLHPCPCRGPSERRRPKRSRPAI